MKPPQLSRWLDFNRPILVFCAATVSAIATDLAAGHPTALRYATEVPILLLLVIVFVWRLGHLRDDDQDRVERSRDHQEPSSNTQVVRRDEYRPRMAPPVGIGMTLPLEPDDPVAPLVLFDRDDYMYVLLRRETVVGWLEPSMNDEIGGFFDRWARRISVSIVQDVPVLHLDGNEAAIEDFRAHARRFFVRYRPDLADAANLPLDDMLEVLLSLTKYRLS